MLFILEYQNSVQKKSIINVTLSNYKLTKFIEVISVEMNILFVDIEFSIIHRSRWLFFVSMYAFFKLRSNFIIFCNRGWGYVVSYIYYSTCKLLLLDVDSYFNHKLYYYDVSHCFILVWNLSVILPMLFNTSPCQN